MGNGILGIWVMGDKNRNGVREELRKFLMTWCHPLSFINPLSAVQVYTTNLLSFLKQAPDGVLIISKTGTVISEEVSLI